MNIKKIFFFTILLGLFTSSIFILFDNENITNKEQAPNKLSRIDQITQRKYDLEKLINAKNSVKPGTRELILDVMKELAESGMTMLVVSHEMGFARAAAQRMIFMDEGKIIEDTTPEALFSAPNHDRTKQFLSKILEH